MMMENFFKRAAPSASHTPALKRLCVTNDRQNVSFQSSSKLSDVKLPFGFKSIDSSLLVRTDERCASSGKIAAFDFDGCLASTSLYKRGPNAWRVYHANVKPHLELCLERGYKLVIFSNEMPIGRTVKPKTKAAAIEQKLGRLNAFVEYAELPFQVFVATKKDSFKKPETGMWDFMVSHCTGPNETLNFEASFFVGDAAGRLQDHSDSDRVFASRIPLRFFTEAAFHTEPVEAPWFLDVPRDCNSSGSSEEVSSNKGKLGQQ